MKSAYSPVLPAVRYMLLCILLLLSLQVPSLAAAEQIDCLKCHGKLAKEKVLHPALSMGCTTCHDALNAKTVPHKIIGKTAKGLAADQPDLCYRCHDRAAFSKKTVHAAVGMGCTGCHNPHSSRNAKLLVSEPPDLCFTCHEKTKFTKKTIHAPVAGGMCLSCHVPHSSDEMALLKKKPFDTCLECHRDIMQKHAPLSGFSSKRHPLGESRKKKPEPPQDPARPGKIFYCGSCHDPHSADGPRMYRFNAASSMALCVNCHQM